MLVLVAALALQAVPAARAQITIGIGHKPSLAVDASGTAYIAWFSDEFHSSLRFCRLARGAQTCAGAPTIVVGGHASTGTSLSRPFVSVAGNTVRVVQHRYGFGSGSWERAMLYTSRNGGDSWDAGISLADGATSRFEVGALDTGTRFVAVLNGGGFRSLPLNADVGSGPVFDPLPGLSFSASVAELPGGGMLATAERYKLDTAFSVNPAGTPTVPAAWGPPVSLGYVTEVQLASTRSGPVLMARDSHRQIIARRWQASGFGPPVGISPGNGSWSHLSADAGGRLHAVIPDGEAIKHAVSDDGVSWSTGILHTEWAHSMRVAAAPDHVGLTVWAASGAIRAAPIGPGAPAGRPEPPRHVPAAPRTVTPPATSPEPIAGEQVVADVRSGTVRVRPPRGRFAPLTGSTRVPIGAQIDARRGALELRFQVAGGIESVTISGGIFGIAQKRTNAPRLRLVTPPKRSRACAAKRSGPAKGVVRTLTVAVPTSTVHTVAMKGVVTGRNATWTVADRCDGTHTSVQRGRVTVRSARSAVSVRAGRSHLLRARLFAAKRQRG